MGPIHADVCVCWMKPLKWFQTISRTICKCYSINRSAVFFQIRTQFKSILSVKKIIIKGKLLQFKSEFQTDQKLFSFPPHRYWYSPTCTCPGRGRLGGVAGWIKADSSVYRFLHDNPASLSPFSTPSCTFTFWHVVLPPLCEKENVLTKGFVNKSKLRPPLRVCLFTCSWKPSQCSLPVASHRWAAFAGSDW